MTRPVRANGSRCLLVLVLSLLAVLGPRAHAGPGTGPVVGSELDVDTPRPALPLRADLATASDGVHFIVVWKDLRPRGTAFRAARYRISDGVLLDPAGFEVLTDPYGVGYERPSVACRDASQCLLVVSAYSGSGKADLRTARFSPMSASSADPAGQVVASVKAGDQPNVATNGTGYLVSVRSLAPDGLLGMRIDPSTGKLVAGTVPVVMSTDGGDARVASDGTNYLVSSIHGFTCTVSQRSANDLSEIGSALTFEPCLVQDVAFAGGYYVLGWLRNDGPNSRPFVMSRIRASDGVLVDPAPIVVEPDQPFLAGDAQVVSDGVSVLASAYRAVGQTSERIDLGSGVVSTLPTSGRFMFSGGASRFLIGRLRADGSENLDLHRLADDGTMLDALPLARCHAAAQEMKARVACSPDSCFGVWVTPEDAPSPKYDIYGARLVPGGPVMSSMLLGYNRSGAPAVAYDGTDFLVAWQNFNEVLMARVRASDGVLMQTELGLGFNGASPELTATKNAILLTYILETAGAPDVALAVRLNPANLAPLSPGAQLIGYPRGVSRVLVATDGTDFLLAWRGPAPDGTGVGLRVRRMAANGTLAPNEMLIAGPDASFPALVFAGGNYVLAYTAPNASLGVVRVRASDGAILDNPAQVLGSDVVDKPMLGFDGGAVLVAWLQETAPFFGTHRLVAQRLRGTDLVPLDASPLVIFPEIVSFAPPEAAVGAQAGGPFAVLTQRFLSQAPYDNERVRLRYVSADPLGATCADKPDCSSGFCVDGVCCNTACGGGDPNDCSVCSLASGAVIAGQCGETARSECMSVDAGPTVDVDAGGDASPFDAAADADLPADAAAPDTGSSSTPTDGGAGAGGDPGGCGCTTASSRTNVPLGATLLVFSIASIRRRRRRDSGFANRESRISGDPD
ncbi:MAG: Flagellar hook-length control protein FliK [Myxococcaceae bacterium]|nr:Flagellar hook-length control protein FliK [Myxococcaceae bacterium]